MKTLHPLFALVVAAALASTVSRVMAEPETASTGAEATACPTQAMPALPRIALNEGRMDSVQARALVQGGVVREVQITHGPRIYRNAIQSAMSQYRCRIETADYWVSQDFVMDARVGWK